MLGVAADWYYNSHFTSIVLAQTRQETTSWKLYEKTADRTVDDACLAGAGLGLAASLPALFMRRLAIPRWTRCLGLINIGASAGILAAHGYLQSTGSRRAAYASLDTLFERRSTAFWNLFWDKPAMNKFNPLLQLYIRHNALWYAQQQLPDDFAEDHRPTPYTTTTSTSPADNDTDADADADADTQSYYLPPFDYAADLAHIDVPATLSQIAQHEADIAALRKDADFILMLSAHRQYEYCHLPADVSLEERRERLEELQILQITWNKLRSGADVLSARLIGWRMSLRHKALLEEEERGGGGYAHGRGEMGSEGGTASPSPSPSVKDGDGDDEEDDLDDDDDDNDNEPHPHRLPWLPPSTHRDFSTHRPAFAILELRNTQDALVSEIRAFEAGLAAAAAAGAGAGGVSRAQRDRWRKDAEDGRALLRIADRLVWGLEKLGGGSGEGVQAGGQGGSGSGRCVKQVGEADASRTDLGALGDQTRAQKKEQEQEREHVETKAETKTPREKKKSEEEKKMQTGRS